MSILVEKINELSHRYVRGGSKQNRRLQVGRMIKFVSFIEETEKLHGLQEIGKRHVIQFWKSHREFSAKTANGYWLALCILWKLIGKTGTPPKPLVFSKQTAKAVSTTETCESSDKANQSIATAPVFNELAKTIQSSRLSKTLTIEELSQTTGLDYKIISDIEAGNYYCGYADIAELSNFSNFKFKQIKG